MTNSLGQIGTRTVSNLKMDQLSAAQYKVVNNFNEIKT